MIKTFMSHLMNIHSLKRHLNENRNLYVNIKSRELHARYSKMFVVQSH